jgi:hypothetical protein
VVERLPSKYEALSSKSSFAKKKKRKKERKEEGQTYLVHGFRGFSPCSVGLSALGAVVRKRFMEELTAEELLT